jgi:hypothetical protein
LIQHYQPPEGLGYKRQSKQLQLCFQQLYMIVLLLLVLMQRLQQLQLLLPQRRQTYSHLFEIQGHMQLEVRGQQNLT